MFNRRKKTDSFINRGSANSRMNETSNTAFESISRGNRLGEISPWQNTMMSHRSLLPTPNSNMSLLLSQKEPVVASNLLRNLFSKRQEVQPQIPSLLSLKTKFPGSGPSFSNQQSLTSERYSHGLPQRSIKTQRFQPYYQMGTKARDDPVRRHGPPIQQFPIIKSGSQRTNGNQTEHRIDKSSKSVPAFKQIQTARKEQQNIKTSNNNEKVESPALKSEKVNELANNKCRCQDEKSAEDTEAIKVKGEKNTEDANKNIEKSVTENTPKDMNTSIEKDAKTPVKKSENRHAESRYAEVPMSYMFCHICDKHMWNGFSFENHLRGRVHQLMIEKLDESYKLKAALMRHEMLIIEEQRKLHLANQKRRRNKASVDWHVREYCTMCDLNFYGTLFAHRQSEKHQQLKAFLHPRCSPCSKEFSSRIEYDKHCLTLIHMKNTVRYEEECENTGKDNLAKGEIRSKNEKEDLSEQEYVLDIIENLNEQQLKIPSYKYCRQNQICIGKSMVKEVQGFYCERCRHFMFRAEGKNAHLRSVTHYKNFVAEIKSLTSNTEAAEAKEDEQIKNKTDISINIEEHEKNWERRNIIHNEIKDIEEIEPSIKDMNVQGSTIQEDTYDPLKADIESEEGESYQRNIATLNKDLSIDKMDIDKEIDDFINDTNKKEFTNQEKSTQNMDQNRNSQVKSSKYSEISECGLYTRRSRR